MERAKLIVKNFGPLKDIEIEVREMVTFIGAQASGKSTLAKLLSIFEDENFRRDRMLKFEDELKKYSILSYLNEDTRIEYDSLDKYSFKFNYSEKKFNKNTPQIYLATAKGLSNKDDIEREETLCELIKTKIYLDIFYYSLFKNNTFYKIFDSEKNKTIFLNRINIEKVGKKSKLKVDIADIILEINEKDKNLENYI